MSDLVDNQGYWDSENTPTPGIALNSQDFAENHDHPEVNQNPKVEGEQDTSIVEESATSVAPNHLDAKFDQLTLGLQSLIGERPLLLPEEASQLACEDTVRVCLIDITKFGRQHIGKFKSLLFSEPGRIQYGVPYDNKACGKGDNSTVSCAISANSNPVVIFNNYEWLATSEGVGTFIERLTVLLKKRKKEKINDQLTILFFYNGKRAPNLFGQRNIPGQILLYKMKKNGQLASEKTCPKEDLAEIARRHGVVLPDEVSERDNFFDDIRDYFKNQTLAITDVQVEASGQNKTLLEPTGDPCKYRLRGTNLFLPPTPAPELGTWKEYRKREAAKIPPGEKDKYKPSPIDYIKKAYSTYLQAGILLSNHIRLDGGLYSYLRTMTNNQNEDYSSLQEIYDEIGIVHHNDLLKGTADVSIEMRNALIEFEQIIEKIKRAA